jgi:hypothetical protein
VIWDIGYCKARALVTMDGDRTGRRILKLWGFAVKLDYTFDIDEPGEGSWYCNRDT